MRAQTSGGGKSDGQTTQILLNLTAEDIDLISGFVGTGWKPLIQNMRMILISPR